MSDSYQAVYDAVRSRIGSCDVSQAIENALGANASGAMHQISMQAMAVGESMQMPHVLMKPRVFPDGNRWCALYGENLQDGVCGFGKSPAEAAADFDSHWWKKTE